MSDERRIHVLINDKESLAWLKNQKNMSASIRLLIRQIANSGNMNDYVMHCAEQAPSPFNSMPETTTSLSDVEPIVNKTVEVKSEETIIDVNGEVVEPKVVDVPEIIEEEEEVLESIPEPETVDSQQVEQIVEDDEYWEQEEEVKQNRIARMMQDFEKKQNSN